MYNKKFRAVSLLETAICLVIFSILMHGTISIYYIFKTHWDKEILNTEYNRIAYAASLYGVQHGYLPLPFVPDQASDASVNCEKLDEIKGLTLTGEVPWNELGLKPSKHKIFYTVSATAVQRPKNQKWNYSIQPGNIFSMIFANPRWYGQPVDPWDNEEFNRSFPSKNDSVAQYIINSGSCNEYLITQEGEEFKPIISYQVPRRQVTIMGAIVPEVERLAYYDDIFGFLPKRCVMDGSYALYHAYYYARALETEKRDLRNTEYNREKEYYELSCNTRYSPLGVFFGLLAVWDILSPEERNHIYSAAYLSRLSRATIFNENILALSAKPADHLTVNGRIWTRNELLYLQSAKIDKWYMSYVPLRYTWRQRLHDEALDYDPIMYDVWGDGRSMNVCSMEGGLVKRKLADNGAKYCGLSVYAEQRLMSSRHGYHRDSPTKMRDDQVATYDNDWNYADVQNIAGIAANVLGCASVPDHRFLKDVQINVAPLLIYDGPSRNFVNINKDSVNENPLLYRRERQYKKKFPYEAPAIVSLPNCEYYIPGDICSTCQQMEYSLFEFIMRCLDTTYGYYSTKPLRLHPTQLRLDHQLEDLESDSIIIRFAIIRMLDALKEIDDRMSDTDEEA